ncbi:hypothetical protein H5T51_04665 [Candidatus Bathyarchaeota archaeon]|nr:hypothetical protein [Candidatus Bathyarchaeota archaeon]
MSVDEEIVLLPEVCDLYFTDNRVIVANVVSRKATWVRRPYRRPSV